MGTSNHELNQQERKSHPFQNPASRLVAAFFFIIAGLLLIGNRTGYLSESVFYMLFNWQMLLIAIGLTNIAKKGGNAGGYIMVLVGLVFLVPVFFDISFNTRQLLFPAILIGIGLIILFRSTSSWQNQWEKRFKSGEISDMDIIDANHIFGGGEYHVTSDQFKGGRINCVFGGGKYDFRKAKLAEGVVVLEVSMVFGGLEVIVPNDWNVKVEVDSILGGFSQKNLDFIAPQKEFSGQLIIRGSAIFGGGELKRL
jgi:predicted membrane protein